MLESPITKGIDLDSVATDLASVACFQSIESNVIEVVKELEDSKKKIEML
jgi:hypothetical protein